MPEENLELRRLFFKDWRHRGGLCVGANDSIRKEELMVQGNERSAGRKFLGKMREEEVRCTSGGGGLRQGQVRWEVSTVGDAEVLSDGRASFLSNRQDAVSTWK